MITCWPDAADELAKFTVSGARLPCQRISADGRAHQHAQRGNKGNEPLLGFL
jgi:hypothetical protein